MSDDIIKHLRAAGLSPVVIDENTNFDSERDTILKSLPVRPCNDQPKWEPNAWVHIDQFGRLSILLKEGGWLGVKPENFTTLEADLAPFHG